MNMSSSHGTSSRTVSDETVPMDRSLGADLSALISTSELHRLMESCSSVEEMNSVRLLQSRANQGFGKDMLPEDEVRRWILEHRGSSDSEMLPAAARPPQLHTGQPTVLNPHGSVVSHTMMEFRGMHPGGSAYQWNNTNKSPEEAALAAFENRVQALQTDADSVRGEIDELRRHLLSRGMSTTRIDSVIASLQLSMKWLDDKLSAASLHDEAIQKLEHIPPPVLSTRSTSAPCHPTCAPDLCEDRGHPGRRHNFTPSQKSILMSWFRDHLIDPYPTQKEKQDLAIATGMGVKQVEHCKGIGFTNKRKRNWRHTNIDLADSPHEAGQQG